MKVLLTTPDYPPKWGGLSTHTVNVEKVLRELGLAHDVFHWQGYGQVRNFPCERLRQYTHVLNIHSGFHMFMPASDAKVVNFINGAEILFHSPNLAKHVLKRLLRGRCLRRIESAHKNIFISDFTRRVLVSKGLLADHSRDLVVHMCVDTAGSQVRVKPLGDGPLRLVCVARDVPHKNFDGVLHFAEALGACAQREVELHTVTHRRFASSRVRIVSHINPRDEERDAILADAHFNVLLSLDQSHRGYFEGFGQVVQEAGRFGTPSVVMASGGLPESVHHGVTGWVVSGTTPQDVAHWWSGVTSDHYARVAQECARHTLASHGLDNWERVFARILV